MNDSFLTPQEIGKLLKISYESALDFIKYSGIDYIKIGRQYRVSEVKLNRFLTQKGQVLIDITEN